MSNIAVSTFPGNLGVMHEDTNRISFYCHKHTIKAIKQLLLRITPLLKISAMIAFRERNGSATIEQQLPVIGVTCKYDYIYYVTTSFMYELISI